MCKGTEAGGCLGIGRGGSREVKYKGGEADRA